MLSYLSSTLQEFFQIFPFNWSTNLFRYEIFGSCRTLVATSAGVLMLYWAVFVGGYLYTALKNEYRKVSDKQFVESKYAATSAASDASKTESKPKSRPAVPAPVPKEEEDDEDEEQNKQSSMDTQSRAEKERIEKERRDALIKNYEAVYEEDTGCKHGKLKDEEERSTVVTASVGDSMI